MLINNWVFFVAYGPLREMSRIFMRMDSGFFQMLLSDWFGPRLKGIFGPDSCNCYVGWGILMNLLELRVSMLGELW